MPIKNKTQEYCTARIISDLIFITECLERFDRGVRVVPHRHLLLVFIQFEFIDGRVGGDQVVEELPQSHFYISCVLMLESLAVDLGH